MKILAVDTSTIVATCAVIDDNKLLGEYILNNKRTHSQKIMPLIHDLLSNLQFKSEDIDVYAASVGPGSFTGLRIGIATIKGLAHVHDKPVIGVPTIDALAYNFPHSNGLIVPIIDARRDRVYTGIYKWNSEFEVIRNQDVLEIDELINVLNEMNEDIIFCGDGIDIYKDRLIHNIKSKIIFAPSHLNTPRASSVAELAKIKYLKGEVEDYYSLVPDYLRKSQAEREYDLKIKGNAK